MIFFASSVTFSDFFRLYNGLFDTFSFTSRSQPWRGIYKPGIDRDS